MPHQPSYRAAMDALENPQDDALNTSDVLHASRHATEVLYTTAEILPKMRAKLDWVTKELQKAEDECYDVSAETHEVTQADPELHEWYLLLTKAIPDAQKKHMISFKNYCSAQRHKLMMLLVER